MHKQPSLIHLLTELTESSQLQPSMPKMSDLQRCDSQDMQVFPEQVKLKQRHEKVTSLQQIKNEVTKENQKIFRLKLKMLGYANSLRADLGDHRDIRASSFEDIFQAVMKRIKQISKASEAAYLQNYTKTKNQQIIILNLKTQNDNLKQQLSRQVSNCGKIKKKMQTEIQKLCEKQKQYGDKLQNMEHQFFMANQLIKQQQGFIKQLTGEHQTAQQKYRHQINGYVAQIGRLKQNVKNLQDNQKVYEQAMKNYQIQTNQLLKSLQEAQNTLCSKQQQLNKYMKQKQQQLQANEQKLIAYYQLYQRQVERVNKLCKQHLQEEKVIKLLVQENKRIEEEYKELKQKDKENRKKLKVMEEEKKQLREQIGEKDKSIMKLNQQISDVLKNIRGTKILVGKKIDQTTQFPQKNISKLTLSIPLQ